MTAVAVAPSTAEVLWEQRRRRYRGRDGDAASQLDGFVAWCNENVWIKHPLGKRLIELRDEQVDMARSCIENERSLFLKARQIGFTTVVMNYVLWRALFFDDWDTIILNRREEDAKYNLRMAVFTWDNLPPEIRDRLPQRTNDNVQVMSFSNGSMIESHPSNNNPARGRTAKTMVLDEWAFMPNPDEAWASVEPATDIGGSIIALSTANGWGNLFHKTWQGAEAGDNDFHALFFSWSSVSERNADWYEAKKRAMPAWQLAQEYPSNAREAFIQSGSPFFDVEVLERQPVDAPERGDLVGPEHRLKGRTWRSNQSSGKLRIWAQPMPYVSYVIGADVAEGLEHGDYSSAHVIDCKTGAVVAAWHGHIDPDLFGFELAALGWYYNSALVGVEANNHGLTTVKAVQRSSYPRIYMRRRYGHRREVVSEQLGWFTSTVTKPMMCDDLAASMRMDELILFDEATRNEMMTYSRNAKGALSGSPHDDRVMSLAIANQMRKHAFGAEAPDPEPDKEWTMAWATAQIKPKKKERMRLGQYNMVPHGH